MREYIYILKLVPRLYDQKNWTEEDNKIVSEHFIRLKRFCDEGKVVTAGKTDREDIFGFGIVIFKEENEEKAAEFMKDDPAVKYGIMNAEVFPYRTALLHR